MDLPAPIEEIVESLATMPGTVAVVLGGSRAAGSSDAESDWDLGVYYRGSGDLARGCRAVALGAGEIVSCRW
jgi:predicted nucleotidyltransferase